MGVAGDRLKTKLQQKITEAGVPFKLLSFCLYLLAQTSLMLRQTGIHLQTHQKPKKIGIFGKTKLKSVSLVTEIIYDATCIADFVLWLN